MFQLIVSPSKNTTALPSRASYLRSYFVSVIFSYPSAFGDFQKYPAGMFCDVGFVYLTILLRMRISDSNPAYCLSIKSKSCILRWKGRRGSLSVSRTAVSSALGADFSPMSWSCRLVTQQSFHDVKQSQPICTSTGTSGTVTCVHTCPPSKKSVLFPHINHSECPLRLRLVLLRSSVLHALACH